jgi:hypothetical protein
MRTNLELQIKILENKIERLNLQKKFYKELIGSSTEPITKEDNSIK